MGRSVGPLLPGHAGDRCAAVQARLDAETKSLAQVQERAEELSQTIDSELGD